MIKIGVVSDTHIHSIDNLPRIIIDSLKQMDLILHAGDFIDLDVLEGFKKINPQLKAVYGNMDSWAVRQALAEMEIICLDGIRIGLVHGSGAPANLMQTVADKFKGKDVNCIVYGHSHLPQNTVSRSILFFNPGSPTDKVFAPYNSFGILEVTKQIKGKIIKL
ncbi:MAG: metallophosphoesterase family protein [Candidatus Omnitrophota bacterium]